MSKKKNKEPMQRLWVRIVCGILGALMVLGIVVMAVQVMGYASETEPSSAPSTAAGEVALPTGQMISVGLRCGADAVASFALCSESGFQVSYRKSDSESEDLFSSASKELIAAVDANIYRYGSGLTTENLGIAALGGYHIQISYFSFAALGIDTDRDNPVYIEPDTPSNVTDGYTRTSVTDSIAQLSSITAIQKLEQPIFPYYTADKTYIRLGSFYTADEAKAALSELEKNLNLRATVVSPDKDVLTLLNAADWTPVCELSTAKYELSVVSASGSALTDLGGRIYRGSMQLKRVLGAAAPLMQVVNRLPLEEYVAALLSYEVASNENAELLKAMAVILRTEATKHLGIHQKDGYDVCSDSHCHRFSGGLADSAAIRQAVLDTAGQLITYQGAPIHTPYNTLSGGSTVSSEAAFGSSFAYLPSNYTPWEESGEEESWCEERSPYELYQMLTQHGYDTIKGNIKSIERLKTAENSDYVIELALIDLFGNRVVLTGSETIRMLLGLPSANFIAGNAGDEVTLTLRKPIGDQLEYKEEQTKEVLDGTYGSFVFSGKGVGCGVGFSIAGARALSRKGYSYDEILNLYYPNTEIK